MPQDDMLGKYEWSRSFTLLMFLRFTGGGHRMRESSFMRTITWRRMERTGGGNIERKPRELLLDCMMKDGHNRLNERDGYTARRVATFPWTENHKIYRLL